MAQKANWTVSDLKRWIAEKDNVLLRCRLKAELKQQSEETAGNPLAYLKIASNETLSGSILTVTRVSFCFCSTG